MNMCQELQIFFISLYVFGCKFVRLCDSDFGITPVDANTIGITYYYYYYYLLQLSFHSVAAVLTLVTNKNK